MVEYNFLKNWSFEDDAQGSGWTATALKKFDELCVEDKVTDSLTGTKHYHFWGSGNVEFTLEQEISGLKAGEYKFALSTMGGDCGEYTSYIYVKINGQIMYQSNAEFTVYNSWHLAEINGIMVSEGDVVTVGLYFESAGAGNGAWGKIDDAMLNSVN